MGFNMTLLHKSNSKNLDFKKKCRYVTWSAYMPCIVFVESLCFAGWIPGGSDSKESACNAGDLGLLGWN